LQGFGLSGCSKRIYDWLSFYRLAFTNPSKERRFDKGTNMKARISLIICLSALCAMQTAAQAQGIVGGAERGAAAGHRAAGPVGGVVGGAVGGVTGGVVGGVKGVLGIPQHRHRHHIHHHHHHYY
jgi:hypothetical protein